VAHNKTFATVAPRRSEHRYDRDAALSDVSFDALIVHFRQAIRHFHETNMPMPKGYNERIAAFCETSTIALCWFSVKRNLCGRELATMKRRRADGVWHRARQVYRIDVDVKW